MTERILIIDPDTSGHHPNYLGLVAMAFAGAGCDVTVAADLAHAAIREQLDGQPWATIDFRVPSLRGGRNRDLALVRDQVHYWRRCRALIRALAATGWRGRVFFPYLDRIVHAIGLLGSPGDDQPCAGILMRPQFGARQGGGFRQRLRQRLLSWMFRRLIRGGHLDQLCVIDPLTAADTRSAIADASLPLTELVDPADCFRSRPRATARALLGVPADGHLVLVYGEIARRKAVPELIAALSERPGFGRALVVGRSGQDLGTSLLDAVGGDAERLASLMIRIDRRVSDAEERLAFEAADSVWVAYHDHPGMSGVLVQAGQMGLPVFGCAAGAIGLYCRDRSVGLPLEPRDPQSVLAALDRAAADPAAFAALGDNGHAVFRHFTRASFRRTLAQRLGSSVPGAEAGFTDA